MTPPRANGEWDEKGDPRSPKALQHLKDEERKVYQEDRKGGWRGRRETRNVCLGSRG